MTLLLYPWFAGEKQESTEETKTSMGTVAPVSSCLWLLPLLGGLCLPFWAQVVFPPSFKRPATPRLPLFFHPVKWLQRCCRFILCEPWHPSSRAQHLWLQWLFVILHLQKSPLHFYPICNTGNLAAVFDSDRITLSCTFTGTVLAPLLLMWTQIRAGDCRWSLELLPQTFSTVFPHLFWSSLMQLCNLCNTFQKKLH